MFAFRIQQTAVIPQENNGGFVFRLCTESILNFLFQSVILNKPGLEDFAPTDAADTVFKAVEPLFIGGLVAVAV